MGPDGLALLRLLQLADSALPVGAAAHSFGLESLFEDGLLAADELERFLRGYLEESGALEAGFCRAAYQLSQLDGDEFATEWLDLNERLSARKAPRESREASLALGRRFLGLAAELLQGRLSLCPTEQQRRKSDVGRTRSSAPDPLVRLPRPSTSSHVPPAVLPASPLSSGLFCMLTDEARWTGGLPAGLPAVRLLPSHHVTAFGLVAAQAGVDERSAVLAWLHQSVTALVSAAQRLAPIGQTRASHILWALKPLMADVAQRPGVDCFTPLPEIASMRHAKLSTRLFIS